MVEHEEADRATVADNESNQNAQNAFVEMTFAGLSLILCRILGSLIRDASEDNR